MAAAGLSVIRGCILNDALLLRAAKQQCTLVQRATLMKLRPPPNYEGVEYPERRKLRFFDKVPQLPAQQRPPKMMKDLYLMRGPEPIHTELQYGQFGIQAMGGGSLRWGHLEMIRLTINRKMDESRMFAVWRVDQPWKSITKKGQGHRMGGGKGNIDHYVVPLRAGRIIVEMGGHCEFEEVEKILKQVARILPFRARVVTRQMMAEEEEEAARLEEKNVNPFSFRHCAHHNMLGCQKWLSPYDYKWHGKYH
ncbi:large ribosomal subunit protein uL16m-like [Babylonia areolata]|uniref:large ribosomal subunit protein uL16m-like n=1 Tax=Babylonia areolata TaxID=304850 RepID=UPI003FD156D7